ncbi:hypothetical protein FITA111629_13815 [Filibacter tadaridae]|uniref:Glycosyl transferases group 1 n=1 Tax=Filibacter tadaridae TaxID=2483811 RepID=A0A3P5XFU3_9BACL|nr:hypothetical protein [Filibacter tadaridae]VDC33703.1 hypothetical protein FILTAD_03013 [Filibacter tadaridae]
MKVMFIVYHDIQTEARSQEILECAKKLSDETILVSYSKPFDTSNYKCILTGNGERNYFSFIKGAIKAIKNENPDIVILHDNYTSTILRWITKHRKNIYVIYDSSELYIGKNGKRRTLKMKIAEHMRYFERKYLKYANIVIAANIERANIMKDYYGLDEVPIVFDNIHRIDDTFNVVECEQKYGHLFNSDSFNILYAGGIAEHRLTFELAEAVGKLGSKYQLIVIGQSTAKDKDKFNSMLSTMKYSNIFYAGFISRGEMKYMLKNTNVSVSIFALDTVNNINCASGKLYESLFEGIPLLTSENPPLKRICTDYKVGISSNDFSQAIVELEGNYDYFIENVKVYTESLDVEGRIDTLVEQLKEKMKTDNIII